MAPNPPSAEAAAAAAPAPPPLKYNTALRADITVAVSTSGPLAAVHRVEWKKIMAGEPVEINPSVGTGYRVMAVEEWAARCGLARRRLPRARVRHPAPPSPP
jgi:hypothetical protein